MDHTKEALERKLTGLVITGDSGGDYSVVMVDARLWEQIERIPQAVEAWVDIHGSSYNQVFHDWVGWLSFDDAREEEPCPKPEGCPDREGRIIETWYCQSPVIETLDIEEEIKGLVFLQG